MSYSTKLRATLPKDRDSNGMAAIREELLRNPMTQHVAIVVFDCHRIVDDIDDLVRTPIARILRIEPETDADRAVELLARARELAEARNPQTKPLLDVDEAAGLRNATGLRLAGGLTTGGGRGR
jgi:hypothetical protein